MDLKKLQVKTYLGKRGYIVRKKFYKLTSKNQELKSIMSQVTELRPR